MRRLALPLALRRPRLLWRNLVARRREPPLAELEALQDPEAFLWAVLPHAARSFSACIALLPEAEARATAIAYLYCRCLDTCEDLSPTPARAEEALVAFARRFEAGPEKGLGAPPDLGEAIVQDDRDRVHLLLLRRVERVDALYRELADGPRQDIAELVAVMASRMAESTRRFQDQEGVLENREQRRRYGDGVLGRPLLFCLRLAARRRSGERPGGARIESLCARSGHFFQVANMVRDVEKDLERGVAYDAVLRPYLRAREAGSSLEVPAAVIAALRAHLIEDALGDGSAFCELMGEFERVSGIGRVGGLAMLGFTERFYRGAFARLSGAEEPPRGRTRILRRALWGGRSARACRAALAQSEERMGALAARIAQWRAPNRIASQDHGSERAPEGFGSTGQHQAAGERS